MNMLSTVSEKGQITVPKRLRDRLGIHPGDRLELVEDAGRLIATKTVPGEDDPVDTVYGILNLDVSTDEAIQAMRGEPEPE
jgi:AbrB family looped-hinge helix DNA binding protein